MLSANAAWLWLGIFLAKPHDASLLLHSPRGLNNRCDEPANGILNPTRLFHSNNPPAAGYGPCPNRMLFYEGSELEIAWTMNPACHPTDPTGHYSDRNERKCQVILQMACEDTLYGVDAPETLVPTSGRPMSDMGPTCVDTAPTYDECPPDGPFDIPACQLLSARTNPETLAQLNAACRCTKQKWPSYGYHEPRDYYDLCKRAQGSDSAMNLTISSQNPRGFRYGFECQAERDHYPFWRPSPWRDIAILAPALYDCLDVAKQSENVVGRYQCYPNGTDASSGDFSDPLNKLHAWNRILPALDEKTCQGLGGLWLRKPAHRGLPVPECGLIGRTRDYAGGQIYPSSAQDGRSQQPNQVESQFASYRWTVPSGLIPTPRQNLTCVLRVRYNVSLPEQASFAASAPVVLLGAKDSSDAAQALPIYADLSVHGPGSAFQVPPFTTFQDRSDTFQIVRRAKATAVPDGARILNLNVLGKRGTLDQVQPALPYAFVPWRLEARPGDWVHFQWCGFDGNAVSNTGVGRVGTDRHNVVPIRAMGDNLPLVLSEAPGLFSQEDLRLLAWLNQTNCLSVKQLEGLVAQSNTTLASSADPRACHLLNGAPTPYFSHLARVQRDGVFYFMSSRNNAFPDRLQKGAIYSASTGKSVWLWLSVAFFSVVLVGLLAVLGSYLWLVLELHRRQRSCALKP